MEQHNPIHRRTEIERRVYHNQEPYGQIHPEQYANARQNESSTDGSPRPVQLYARRERHIRYASADDHRAGGERRGRRKNRSRSELESHYLSNLPLILPQVLLPTPLPTGNHQNHLSATTGITKHTDNEMHQPQQQQTTTTSKPITTHATNTTMVMSTHISQANTTQRRHISPQKAKAKAVASPKVTTPT